MSNQKIKGKTIDEINQMFKKHLQVWKQNVKSFSMSNGNS